jgi:site-specific DNA-methyltransferase (adenine-specific)
MISTGPGWELRHGKWQDELADVECDAIVCDPPYGARTHDASTELKRDQYSVENLRPQYTGWRANDVRDFVVAWTDRCRGWMVALTSHDLIPAWEAAYVEVGRYCFAPIPCVMRGMSVRLAGDGPSSWTVFAVVSRPRSKAFATWGTLDGAYTGPRGSEAGGGRGKPSWLMDALVRDYSRPGDLICDPFAGWGSTLAAAVANNRRAIGSEMDADAFNEATRRLSRPIQVDLFGGAA